MGFCGPSDRCSRQPLSWKARVVRRGVLLTDVRWARIEPLLPDRTPRRSVRRRDHRRVIDAIVFEYRTGDS
ncbi:hypothetical protein CP977_01360 [Streptomyces cinereoruber]|uniref:Insertion element IS402-like domain-containing protein n=1 Tax=Streptomyces cinereoruber TaxID=67260 RepID=A0ABX6B6R4_9ACTN|nr:hypothetical protein CP977_01360 [Streptomyces cinereoruber]